jgi:hypothetical protein
MEKCISVNDEWVRILKVNFAAQSRVSPVTSQYERYQKLEVNLVKIRTDRTTFGI